MPAVKRSASEIDDEDSDVLIMAIDFGTTYSGVAYCFTKHRDPKPLEITVWPGTLTSVARTHGFY